MYMPGRFRTASRPSRTVMEDAPYSGTEVPTAAGAAGSCLVVPFKGFPHAFDNTHTPRSQACGSVASVRPLTGIRPLTHPSVGPANGLRHRPAETPPDGSKFAPDRRTLRGPRTGPGGAPGDFHR